MPRIINTNGNASELLDGIRFTCDRGQWISEPVERPVAERFASIPGFMMVDDPLGDGDKTATGKAERPAWLPAAFEDAESFAAAYESLGKTCAELTRKLAGQESSFEERVALEVGKRLADAGSGNSGVAQQAPARRGPGRPPSTTSASETPPTETT